MHKSSPPLNTFRRYLQAKNADDNNPDDEVTRSVMPMHALTLTLVPFATMIAKIEPPPHRYRLVHIFCFCASFHPFSYEFWEALVRLAVLMFRRGDNRKLPIADVSRFSASR